MKFLKSVLALSMAVSLSVSTFANENALSNIKDSAKTSMHEFATSAKDKATKVANEKVSAAKNLVNEKTSAVKNTLTEKASSTKNKMVEKENSAKQSLTTKSANIKDQATALIGKKININTADEKTLQSLAGIGEAKAKAIVEYRNKVGKIKSAAELSSISGIGSSTIDKIAPYLSFK